MVSLPSRIALVGFMGAGKSTVGRLLAARTGYRFVDSDAVVESHAGAPVADIFRLHGEVAFRALEQKALEALLAEEGLVIATGGGAFAQSEGAEALLKSAFVVYLSCDFDEAFRRAARRGGRPLLDKGRNEARALLAERKDKYSRAHASVDATHRSPDDVAEDILLLLASSSPVH